MSSASTTTKPSRRPGGRDRRSEPIEVRNSKTLSYILRHGAAKEGLAIRTDGYVRVTDLVSCPHDVFRFNETDYIKLTVPKLARPKLKELDLPGIFKIVEADQKQRYQLGVQFSSDDPIAPIKNAEVPESTAVLWIRANQGHTLKVSTSFSDDLKMFSHQLGVLGGR
jgi:2'-phosphotransferase